MTAQKHGNVLPLPFMTQAECQNGVLADAKFIPTYGGNNRFMREWTTGETIAGNPPVAPIVPQRPYGYGVLKPGHDHSGGVMGQPIIHTIWSAVYGYPIRTINTANLEGSKATQNRVTTGVRNTIILDTLLRASAWVMNCGPDGCYFSALLTVYVDTSATCYVRVRFENDGAVVDQTFGSINGKTLLSVTNKVRLKPGRLQFARLAIYAAYDAATADASVLSAALHQTRTAP